MRRFRSVMWPLGAAALSMALAVLPIAPAPRLSVAAAQAPESLRTAIAVRYPQVRWVTTETLSRWLEGERPIVLLDARAAEEHAVSHLRGARRIDPDAPDVGSVPRDARVVVYCSVGWRSGGVADRLREAGHRDVYNLEGGIFAWANEGRPVFRGDRRVGRVHPYDAVWGRMLRAELRASQP